MAQCARSRQIIAGSASHCGAAADDRGELGGKALCARMVLVSQSEINP